MGFKRGDKICSVRLLTRFCAALCGAALGLRDLEIDLRERAVLLARELRDGLVESRDNLALLALEPADHAALANITRSGRLRLRIRRGEAQRSVEDKKSGEEREGEFAIHNKPSFKVVHFIERNIVSLTVFIKGYAPLEPVRDMKCAKNTEIFQKKLRQIRGALPAGDNTLKTLI